MISKLPIYGTLIYLLLQLKDNREQERKIAIREGFLADPEKKTTLAEAITPVGTCQDMCPDFERVERIVQHAVDKCERVGSYMLMLIAAG